MRTSLPLQRKHLCAMMQTKMAAEEKANAMGGFALRRGGFAEEGY